MARTSFNMIVCFLFVFYSTGLVSSDWAADWMTPLQHEIKLKQEHQGVIFKSITPMQSESVIPIISEIDDTGNDQTVFDMLFQQSEDSDATMKGKLSNMLKKAKTIAEILGKNIQETELRENLLKEAIVNGRHGVTTVKVFIQNQVPRWYIVSDGQWSYCDGYVQDNANFGQHNLFSDMYSTPQCIGQKIPIARDPCAFNSIIKYEILPSEKLSEYKEDDYLCLNYNFNNSMGHYLSVPKKIVNATCNGMIRTLQDNINECGERTLSEYTLYPVRSASSSLPLEYCQGTANHVCKLLVGWNMSNTTLNNFVYLKDDVQFKTYFMDIRN